MTEDILSADAITEASRSVKLTTGPTGVTYYLEPKYGQLRGIVCRRTDGVVTKCPDSLNGAFTDARNALSAVNSYIQSRGKSRGVLAQTVAQESEPKAEEQPVDEEVEELIQLDTPAIINTSEGLNDPAGETVTQRALRERLAGLTITTEKDAVLPDEPEAPPKEAPKARRQRAAKPKAE